MVKEWSKLLRVPIQGGKLTDIETVTKILDGKKVAQGTRPEIFLVQNGKQRTGCIPVITICDGSLGNKRETDTPSCGGVIKK